MDFIGLIYQFNKRFHRIVHFFVVQTAHVEEVVLEGFRAHSGKLTHTFGGITQNYPTGLFHADIVVDFDCVTLVVFLHAFFGNVAQFIAVSAAANADVTIHLFHERRVAFRPHIQHFVACARENFALDFVVADVHERHSARRINLTHEQGYERGVTARRVNPYFVAFCDFAGIVNQIFCKYTLSIVVYHTFASSIIIPPPTRFATSFLG